MLVILNYGANIVVRHTKGDCAVRAGSLKTAAKTPAKCSSEQYALKYLDK